MNLFKILLSLHLWMKFVLIVPKIIFKNALMVIINNVFYVSVISVLKSENLLHHVIPIFSGNLYIHVPVVDTQKAEPQIIQECIRQQEKPEKYHCHKLMNILSEDFSREKIIVSHNALIKTKDM